jgi:excisionase family DNA binding protein
MPRKKKIEERVYPEVMTINELRSFLRVSYGTAMALINAGKIPARRIGRDWKVPKKAVLDYITRGDPDVSTTS